MIRMNVSSCKFKIIPLSRGVKSEFLKYEIV